MNGQDGFARATGRASVVGGALGLASLVMVLVIESRSSEQMMSASGAVVAGWASFVGASLLAVGLLGLAVRYVPALSGVGRAALTVLAFATAITVGASATLALVVPTLVEHAPELTTDPPAAVPPTFILSGLVCGVSAIVLARALRGVGLRGPGIGLLYAGAVVSMVPLPSRFFLLAIAVGVLVLAEQRSPSVERTPAYAG